MILVEYGKNGKNRTVTLSAQLLRIVRGLLALSEPAGFAVSRPIDVRQLFSAAVKTPFIYSSCDHTIVWARYVYQIVRLVL
ncbi:hypothetical protein RFM98_21480 [Mesorhizobium sp. VK9D]|uniref:hypothetical protein n=1 Tax=Mesorhizobium australafricanum TaxID=3072311 RepID=UPI002A241AC7|nr:hypothetical protein [Mesorhizobium sp. VK9D]MDX8455315.1 hypothetical protein [Mesorhizobium sp. VK9D]